MKIASSCQRPIPWRADSIGPWLNSLGFLSWFGSITSAAIIFLFKDKTGPAGNPWDISAWALLFSILLAEHVYLVVQIVVRGVIHKLDSPGLQKERAERFAMRKQLLEQTFGQDISAESHGPGLSGGEKITRAALEEEARRESIKGGWGLEQQ
jgi:anoctamin-10